MYGVYTTAFTLLVGMYAPVALARRLISGVPLNIRARLGYGLPDGSPVPCGWVHAVSVGEAISAAPIVAGLRRRYPELPLVMTTVTDTGARLVRERLDGIVTHRFFPLDLPGAARRVIAAVNPAFFISVETELWPNLLRRLATRGIPVMIANGRISDRSFGRYRLVRPFMRRMLAHVRVFGMQSEEDARRIIVLGACPERVVVTGNLKNEPSAEWSGASELWSRLLGLGPGRRVWIAGSTHRGEEDMVLDAHRAACRGVPDLVLVIAPRHPERVSEVIKLVRRSGWPAIRRTELPRRELGNAVIVLDTIGELAQLYSIADVVFVGGSLVPLGGHNMLEPALRMKPVLFGPHTENFREAATSLLAAGGAVTVRDRVELADEICGLLADPTLRDTRGRAAYEAAVSQHGAVSSTLELVARFLYPGPTA